ncbi:MAG TPA: hypothetical protein QF753_18635 [Victivallales bacterium]|nr:hypothetical protein [Victivallales bacterium]
MNYKTRAAFIILFFTLCSFSIILKGNNDSSNSIDNNQGQINSLANPNIKTKEYKTYLKKQNELSDNLENLTKTKTPSPLYDIKQYQKDPKLKNSIGSLNSPNIKTKQYDTYVKKQNSLSSDLKNMTEVKTPSPLYSSKVQPNDQLPNYNTPPKLGKKDYEQYLKIQHATTSKLDDMTGSSFQSENLNSQNENNLSNKFLEPPKLNTQDVKNYIESQNESKNEINSINQLTN